MSQEWLAEAGEELAQDRYQFFMRPDPDLRQYLGEIEEEDDPVTGRRARFRMAKVGMVRNAPEHQRSEVKVYIGFDGQSHLPHIRIDQAKPLHGWYQPKRQDGRGRERPCFSEAVLAQPYGGYCAVGCAFCYINSGFRGYRGTGLITVPTDYGIQVRKMLGRARTATAGYFSSSTDPFLPLEEVYRNTEQGARAFVEAGLPIFFLSRRSYPSWAFDLLRKSPYSYAQKSLNTASEDTWRRLSPGALPLADHFEEIRALRAAGIYTSVQVNPIIPGIVDHDEVRLLFERLAEVGNNHVIVKFVEAGYSWVSAMVERIGKRFDPIRAKKFEEFFTENAAGQRTVPWSYRCEAHYKYRAWATKLGMTYATCFEYGPDGKGGWRSVGRDFTTADQCHGQRVPMFARGDLLETFREVEACPPSGCLYCADENNGAARCGSEKFGAADALRAVDYRTPIKV